MVEVVLIRPGSTTFDEEGRIKGALDIPLSELGEEQARLASQSLTAVKLDCLYVAPCESARQTAERICERNFCKQRKLDCLRNLDHGLWQGKLVAEVRRFQPKVYRQFQEHPTDVCPPGGETIESATKRIRSTMERLKRKHARGRIGLVVPEPMASVVRHVLIGGSIGDMWKSEMDYGTWECLQLHDSSSAAKPLVGSLAMANQ